ncbi:hypothetical protein [Marinobacter salarius]|jgi:hypothetical protein|uniref:hypothetical protein n=1 Tax=Marinobacter salarius TaxID=1420917 RepID=UPI0018F22530|nr:hypothetical protein [Marinobacter salarius]MBJ7278202.1 hypothetical protein [Marinobacter salarius]
MTWQDAGIVFTLLLGIWNLYAHLRDSKRTSFINTVTSERVKWIQSTREAISNLCGRSHYWVMTQDEISQEDSNAVRKEIDQLRALVKLKLNPGEPPSMKVIDLVDQMEHYTHLSQEVEMKRILNDIVSTSQVLLKEEWDKVRLEAVEGDLRKKPPKKRDTASK